MEQAISTSDNQIDPPHKYLVGFDNLPDKIIVEIFTHLDTDSFLQAATVCTRWNKIIEDNIEFLSSWFAEDEDQEEEPEQIVKENYASKMPYTEEQAILVQQMNSYKPSEISFHELLGVSHDAEEVDVRSQYKKVKSTCPCCLITTVSTFTAS
jgi:hypothetical protein